MMSHSIFLLFFAEISFDYHLWQFKHRVPCLIYFAQGIAEAQQDSVHLYHNMFGAPVPGEMNEYRDSLYNAAPECCL